MKKINTNSNGKVHELFKKKDLIIYPAGDDNTQNVDKSNHTGKTMPIQELNQILPNCVIMKKTESKRFLGITDTALFDYYVDNRYFPRHKGGVFYRHELLEFNKSGKRLSSINEILLILKLKTAKGKTNTQKLY